jgi:hypothetical protein
MRQIVRRTLRRVATREELWNGNREPFGNLLRWDPQESVISWAWHNHAKYRDRYAAAAADPANAHLTFVRLTSRRDITRFLAESAARPTVGSSDEPLASRACRRGEDPWRNRYYSDGFAMDFDYMSYFPTRPPGFNCAAQYATISSTIMLTPNDSQVPLPADRCVPLIDPECELGQGWWQ